jgi:hypothetical protein
MSISNSAKLSVGNRPPPAPSSGLGTPTKIGNKTPVQRRELSGSDVIIGGGVHPEEVAVKLQKISLEETPSPVALASPSMLMGPSPLTTEPLSLDTSGAVSTSNVESPVTGSFIRSPTGASQKRDRSNSVYSQWSHDFDAEESDSDGEVYGTPAEGLSEVEEENEDDDIPRPANTDRARTANTAAVNQRSGEMLDKPPVARVASSLTRPDLARHASSSVIERATVASQPDMSNVPNVQTHNPNAYIDVKQDIQSDVQKCKEVIHLFLTSRMKEAEALCREADPNGVRMYIGNASAVIQAIKAMMTFDADDLKAALEISKTTSTLSNSLRKPAGSLTGRLAGFVRDRSGINHIKSMTIVEKHAELVYAETLLIKAVLGIVAGGDWVGLIKEA